MGREGAAGILNSGLILPSQSETFYIPAGTVIITASGTNGSFYMNTGATYRNSQSFYWSAKTMGALTLPLFGGGLYTFTEATGGEAIGITVICFGLEDNL